MLMAHLVRLVILAVSGIVPTHALTDLAGGLFVTYGDVAEWYVGANAAVVRYQTTVVGSGEVGMRI
jgi:hypothetical protein